jgi:hypothetical protein
LNKTEKKINDLTVAEFESILKETVAEVVRKEYQTIRIQESRECQLRSRKRFEKKRKS